MPTFHQFKYWYLAAGFPLIIGAAILLSMIGDCKALPDAEQQYSVYSARGFDESIEIAMRYINRAAGCVILVPGTPDNHDIQFIEMTDTPCAVDAMHEGIESGHSANAYRCPSSGKWDIDIEKPGDVHSMVFIGMHEMMHTLGFKDAETTYGIMGNDYKPDGRIWPSDDESAQLGKLCDK
jgi:hypothetical protein